MHYTNSLHYFNCSRFKSHSITVCIAQRETSHSTRTRKFTAVLVLPTMKFQLSSRPRSRALAHDDDAMSSPIKKQRTTCGTPTTLLSEGIFRQRRSNIFDEETEDLLKIRRGVVLQPILTDSEDPLLEQDKDSFSLLAKVLNDDQCCSMFPSVVVDTKTGSDGESVSPREKSA